MARTASRSGLGEHAAHNAMDDPGEIARFHDRCSDLMRELLDGLADAPDEHRTFPQIEDTLGWPRRRIASVLGGVSHLRNAEFAGRRPYRFQDERRSASGRWELWMDAAQARAVRAAPRGYAELVDANDRGQVAGMSGTSTEDGFPLAEPAIWQTGWVGLRPLPVPAASRAHRVVITQLNDINARGAIVGDVYGLAAREFSALRRVYRVLWTCAFGG